MFKIDRDRHYAQWKKAVQRTMKWEVNDDENQGIKQRLVKSKNVYPMISDNRCGWNLCCTLLI